MSSPPENRQQIVEAERKRIARDIHDGVASQLVALIATLDPSDSKEQRIISVLESSLQELKFIVDSLANNFSSIVEALAAMRYRIQPALDRQGIKMNWVMDDAPELDHVNPECTMQILRIAQEALNNTLQHSGATEVEVSCRYKNKCLELAVSDNGQGYDSDKITEKKHGNGLLNMKNRAEVLGGSLELRTNKTQGTSIRLTVAIEKITRPHSID